MMLQWLFSILVLVFVIGLTDAEKVMQTSTEDCKDGIPYDGTAVPDCTLYVDPDKPEMRFLEHLTSE